MMNKIAICLILVLLLAGKKSTPEYLVKGVIHDIPQINSQKSGTLHIYLLTESTFKKPYKGIREIEVNVKRGQKIAQFSIKNVKPGIYGLRCYLDENNNDELDKFLMIPREPWCLSWQNNTRSIPPEFEDIAFRVEGNVSIDLYLDD